MANAFTNLQYHLVFSTKHRKNIILDRFREDLYSYIGGIIRSEKGKIIRIGGTINHIHILADFSKSNTISGSPSQVVVKLLLCPRPCLDGTGINEDFLTHSTYKPIEITTHTSFPQKS